MAVDLVPCSVVIPTWNRAVVLRRTLESLAKQSCQPAQIILVDASEDQATRGLCVERPVQGLVSEVVWQAALTRGAASQRNQGVQCCGCAVIGFFDDDILFEPECVARLWGALQSDAGLGGVNAMIINQRYQPPGQISRLMFRLMAGRRETSYAGQVLGPAINLLPEDRDDLPEIVSVQWLNTGCTFYRREALPEPLFPSNFGGYSLMEDLSLSLIVAKNWKLANARTARIFHDSQRGSHKDDLIATSRMELVNRHYVMTKIMNKRDFGDYAKLAVWELFQLTSCAIENRGGVGFWLVLRGKMLALRRVLNSQLTLGHR